MKTTMLKNVALGLLAFIAFMFLSVVLTPAVAGITVAMAGVANAGILTTDAVRDNVADLDMEDISKTVTEMLPARTPLDTILRQIRKAESMESQIHKFYSVSSKALYDTLVASASTGGGSVGDPASEYTYASGNGLTSYYIQVSNPAIWTVKDTMLMRGLTLTLGADGVARVGESTANLTYDVAFFVFSKTGDVLGIKPLNGTIGLSTNAAAFVMPNFTNTVKLYRMGKGMYETDASTDPFGIIPDPETQYAQYFMAQIQESEFQRKTKKEVNFNFGDLSRQNIYDMRATMEMSFLHGALGHFVHPGNTAQKIYTTEGILRRVTNGLEYGTGSTNRTTSFADVINWCKGVFVGNSGSESRYLFGGSTLMGSLHTVPDIQKQVNGKDPVVKWGIKFTEIVTNFGLLYIYHHPLFSATGWEDKGVILDLEHIRKHEFMPMAVRDLDLKSAGTSLSNATVVSEVSCLTLAYPDCHAIITPKA